MKYKCITKAELPLVGSREHALNEAATRADYFFRQTNGEYQFPAPDGQVTQLIEMLLAAANMPPETATPEAVPVAWEFQHEETGLIDFIDPQQVEWGFEKNNPRWQKIGPVYRHPPTSAPEHVADVRKMVEALGGLLAIISDSRGVEGYHLNGEIAEWDEFEEVGFAVDVYVAHIQQPQGGEDE